LSDPALAGMAVMMRVDGRYRRHTVTATMYTYGKHVYTYESLVVLMYSGQDVLVYCTVIINP